MTTGVIVAAGRGTRMDEKGDKLFLEVKNLPIVGHTWHAFDQHPDIDEIVLVIREEALSEFENLATKINLIKPYSFAAFKQCKVTSIGISSWVKNIFFHPQLNFCHPQ